MARRRRKSREEDQLQALAGLGVLIGFAAYYFSRSISLALISGAVLVALGMVWIFSAGSKRLDRLKRSGMSDIDRMEGRQFEEYLGQLFQYLGYQVEVTPSTRDYGADIILRKDGVTTVVQAKRYSTAVGLEAVQQAYTSINYYGAHNAWAVTNHYFTDPAKNLARANQVRLIEREELQDLVIRMRDSQPVSLQGHVHIRHEGAVARQQTATARKQTAATRMSTSGALQNGKSYDAGPACPLCGEPTYMRNTSRGKAYVCVNVPKCKFFKLLE